jgi:hypothetical protein
MSGAVHRIKTLPPVRHGRNYRPELNPELYEGVRFGWMHILSHEQTWHMKNFRLVCQTKPVNYREIFPAAIRSYEKGKYLTFKYSNSIRIRVNQVQGPNAAVSGLFFDKLN